ncbi:carboxypeptidase regulatory-like domain-containing protein [Pedobacter sp. AW1-32]|uniref:carboxypeptidase regulatory-like domain-containing protein n=1 Tax=Pedobacter sp. AW1-32 TaxID=3383026 RepID=UPI003FF12161
MKKPGTIFGIVFIFLLISFAFKNIKLGRIIGKVSPIEAVNGISIIAGTDTISAETAQGSFSFNNLKQGVYKVLIKTNPPYKETVIENVAVKDSSTTDLGIITLQQ